MNLQIVDSETAASLGIQTRHQRMENGELRFRLTANDGSSYIRTAASDQGGWQNSHYHKILIETFIVQAGWAAMVELVNQEVIWKILRPGDIYTVQPGVPHNMYMAAESVMHTLKHGSTDDTPDWHASLELDARTKSVSEAEILAKESA